MANDVIRLLVQLINADATINQLNRINRLSDTLNRNNINIHLNNGNLDDTIQRFYKLADAIGTAGEVMNGLGDAVGTVGDFTTKIGDMFTDMSKLTSFDVTGQIGKTLTSIVSDNVVGDLDKVRSRFDIMSTFSDYMELAGVSANEANEALQRVNDSILGLPIGLDESAQRLRRYQMFMGDISDATNLTIGVQKAITAGGASASMKNNAYMQIDRLLTSGTLAQPRQWFALMNGLGVSMRFIREAMGVEDMTNSELAAGLVSGDISTNSFLRALESLGEGTSTAAKHLDNALGIYKGTLESWLSNIQFAAVRGGETVLKALNNTLEDTTGKPIVGYLETVRNGMNDFYKTVGSFISENPENIATALETVGRFGKALAGFSGTGLAQKIIDRLLQTSDLFIGIIERLDPQKTEDFIAFASTIAGPLGKLFSVIGDGLPILYGVYDRFKDFDFNSLFDRVADHAEFLANAVSKLLGLIPDGLVRELLAFGMVWGKPLATALHTVGNALGYLSDTLDGFNIGEKGTALTRIIEFAVRHPDVVTMGAALGGLAVGLGSVLAVMTDYDNKKLAGIAEAMGLTELSEVTEKLKDSTKSLDDARNGLKESLEGIEYDTDSAEALARRFKDLQEALYNPVGPSDRTYIIQEMQEIWTELQSQLGLTEGSIDSVTGAWDTQTKVLAANIDAIISYKDEIAKLDVLNEGLSELYSARLRSQIDKDIAAEKLGDRRKELEDARKLVAEYQAAQAMGEEGYATLQRIGSENYYKAQDTVALLAPYVDPLVEQYEAADKAIQSANADIETYTAQVEKAKNEIDSFNQYIAGGRYTLREALEGEDQAALSEALDVLAQDFADLKAAAQEAIGAIVSGFDELDGLEAADTEAAIKSQTQYLETLGGSFQTIEEYLEQARKDGTLSESASQLIQKALSDVEGNAGNIKDIADRIASGTFDTLVQSFEEFSLNKEQTENMMGAINGLLSSLGEEYATAFEENPDVFGLEKIFGENISSTLLMPEEQEQQILEQQQRVMEAVTGTAQAIGGGEEGDEQSLSASITALAGQIDEFIENQIANFSQVLTDLDEQVAQFTDPTLEQLRQKLEDTKTASEHLKTEIGLLADTMNTRSADVSSFANQFTTMASEINGAASALSSLQEAVNNFHGDVSVSGVEALERANGGPVYLARGGFFRPHGTDTVPAMLTPGEFVVRKKAVDHIGMGVLAMINRLDIPNAIDALMSRVHMPFGHQFVTYDNRKSYDNHATVNQNIYTQNPSFTYRRASRFAHAL